MEGKNAAGAGTVTVPTDSAAVRMISRRALFVHPFGAPAPGAGASAYPGPTARARR
jgi:hypothetical protein